MKIVKGVLTYTLIAIGILIGIGILLMGFMFLIPSFKLFGYGFVYNTKTYDIGNWNIKQVDPGHIATQVELNITTTKGVNVHISGDNSDNGASIVSKLYCRYYGFYSGNKDITLGTYSLTLDGNTLKYDLALNGVDGAINYGKECYVDVIVPRLRIKSDETGDKDHALDYSINVKTEKASTSISGATLSGTYIGPLQVSNLSVVNEKGNLEVDGIGDYVKPTTAEVTKPTTMTLDSINIGTKSGTFNFKDINNMVINNNLSIDCGRGDFLFNNLIVTGDMEVVGSNALIDAKNITCKTLKYQSASGAFKVAEVLNTNTSSEVSIKSDNAYVTLGTVNGGELGISTGYGNVTINTTNVSTVINGGHGNIVIDKSTQGIIAETTYGDITVKDYSSRGSFTTTRGKVVVNSTYNSDNVNYPKTVVRLNGKSQLSLDTYTAPFDIVTKDNCTVNINIKNVRTRFAGAEDVKSTISMEKGTLNVHIDNNKPYKLKATGAIAGTPTTTIPTISSGVEYEVLFTDADNLNMHSYFDLKAPKINFV